jgi:uncharacterized Zn-binding protein involved in type VI secretion
MASINIATYGDSCSHGGALIDVLGTEPSVFINNKAIAVGNASTTLKGFQGPCGLYDPPVHESGNTVAGPSTGSPTVFAGGIPIHRSGDVRGCGATTFSTSNVFTSDT